MINQIEKIKNPRISIVVPTYNQGPYIAECLRSIQNQTFRDIEVLIQDACSTDSTESICLDFSAHDSRFHYFREKDAGQSDAINRGLKRSTGELWTWICSDDYYLNIDCLSALVARYLDASTKSRDCVGVYGKAVYVTEKSERLDPYDQMYVDLKRGHFQKTWPLSQPSSILLTKAVREVGGVDENLHLGMDLDLFCKVLGDDRFFVYESVEVAAVRIQPNSKSVKLRLKTAQSSLSLVKKHFGGHGRLRESDYILEYFNAYGKSIAVRLDESRMGRFIRPFYIFLGKLFYRFVMRFIHR